MIELNQNIMKKLIKYLFIKITIFEKKLSFFKSRKKIIQSFETHKLEQTLNQNRPYIRINTVY